MRFGTTLVIVCATVATVAAGAAFGTGLARRQQLQALQAAGSALPLSRRVDGTFDRYTFTTKARTAKRHLSSAQRWIANRVSPLVAYDSDPRVSLFVRGWEQAPPVSAYVNATGVLIYGGNAKRLKEAKRWLVRRNGKQVHVDGWALLDIRQPAARRWWLYGGDGKASCGHDPRQRAALDLIACGYTGLWLDNLLTRPAQWYTPNPGIDDASWGAGLVALVSELRDALPDGVPFTVNAHWTDLDFPYADAPVLRSDAPLVQIAKIADQLLIEGGAIDRGLDYAAPGNTAWSYRRLLAYADAMHGQQVKLQWEKTDSVNLTANATQRFGRIPNCGDADYPARKRPAWRRGDAIWKGHVRTAAFNAATALLTFEPGDSVGDTCEYPGRGWRGYGVNLGTPLAARSDTGTAITRLFANGFVAVNPSDQTLRVGLPDGQVGVNLASTASVDDQRASSSFRLPGRTALVVRYAGATATTPATQ
ncbi:MAG: hypothetical protein QM679_00005 [Patulibacter sp.]